MRSKWDDQPLGIAPDAVIARAMGVSRERVRQVRSARGIPRYQRMSERIRWDDVGLGTRSDAAIASGLGVSAKIVQETRVKKAIPRFNSCGLREARLRLDDVGVWEMHNGGSSINAIAEMADVSPPRIRKELARLGLHRSIAEEFETDAGCDPKRVAAIQHHRKRERNNGPSTRRERDDGNES